MNYIVCKVLLYVFPKFSIFSIVLKIDFSMSEGRFGRAASRLIQSEQNLYKEKALSKKLGKTLPEESVKIPIIGEWDLEPIKDDSQKFAQTTQSPKKAKNLLTKPKKSDPFIVPPVFPARTRSVLQAPVMVHPPKPKAIIGQSAQDDKIVFPPGTITTDLNDILKSRYRQQVKPIPPLKKETGMSDPQFLPLDLFDDSTYEEYPIDELMKDPVAFSRYQDLDGNIYWEKCNVLEYNETTHLFTIEWQNNGKRKQVGRFNIRFEKEKPEIFEQRVAAAKRMAAEYEVELRFKSRIEMMPRENLPELSPDNISSIFEKLGNTGDYKRADEIKQKLVQEISEDFKTVNNKLEFEHELEYNKLIPNRDEFLVIQSHIPKPSDIDLVATDPSYNENQQKISEFLLFAYPTFQRVIFNIWKIFDNSKDSRLLLSGFPNVLTLEEFVTKQYTNLSNVSTTLKQSIQSTLENAVSQTFGEDMKPKEKQMCDQMATLATRMLHTALYVIVQETLSDYTSIFTRYDEANKQQNERPQFHIELGLSKDKTLAFTPTLDKMKEEIISLLQQLEETVNDLPNIKSALFHVDTESVTFTDCTSLIEEKTTAFTEVIDKQFSKMTRFITDHQFLEPILGLDADDYPVSFDPSGKKTLDEYRAQLTEINRILTSVQEEMDDVYIIDAFELSCAGFKGTAIAHLEKLINNFLLHIKSFVMNDLKTLDNDFTEITEKLKKTPETPEELAEMKKYLEKVYDNVRKRNELIGITKDRFAFLEEFHLQNTNEEFQYWCKIRQMPLKISALMDETERMLSVERIKMIRDLKTNQKKLEDEAFVLTEKLSDFATHYTDLEMAVEAVDQINEIEKKVLSLQKEQETFNKHEKLFEFEQGQSKVLQKLVEEFQPLHMLWNLANDWYTTNSNWLDTPFANIKADSMSQFMMAAAKKISKLKKDLVNQQFLVDKILTPLTKRIDAFKQNVPLIMKLKHPGIKTLQWKAISKVVGFEVSPSTDMTLQQFLDLNLGKWSDQITEIANVAAQEYALETALDNMDAELQSKQFVTVMFRDSGQFILNEIDDITTTIDDQLVSTQTILASPFIAPVKERALNNLNKLRKAQKTVDSWISCQKSWLYLQPIFTGTSIQQKLRSEANRWTQVEQIWSRVMTGTHNHPAFTAVMDKDGLLEELQKCNENLEQITLGLNKYLETKRYGFPRFFFLSNDELIGILSHTKDMDRIQEYMQKLFEYVNSVTVHGSEITEMNDSEGEKVALFSPVDTNVPEIEDWLNAFEQEMKDSLRQYIANAIPEYPRKKREEWISSYPAQVVLITNQIMWTQQVSATLAGQKLRGMKVLQQRFVDQLDNLTALVRQPISRQIRQVVSCLLILEVHNRDIIQGFVQDEVTDIEDFKWIQQLRYYWEDETVMVRSINNSFEYSYEYAGNSSRLVITPLTDRCYQTLLSAFKMNLSGAPSGPAGTGKTETVRDCAKALGRACVVYNCSEEVTPEQMSQFFAGLSSSGSWSCFDEFNRINIEVLSVIAQQVRTIQNAIAQNMEKFNLDSRYLTLNPNAAICITMNPGYAGRTELPDNLKALFRPCAMMVPDFVFISEILLFSGGFTTASNLAVKLVALFDLCRKQLSNSHHYDWGLRAMKAILSTAGKAKRKDLNADEAMLLVRTIKDCTAPKLISADLPLFDGILKDVFPNVEYNKDQPEKLIGYIKESIHEINEQPLGVTIKKAIELYETTLVRHGIMLVGGSMGGKSTAWKSLSMSLTKQAKESDNKEGKPVHVESLNPKAISIAELYGSFNPDTQEWSDGVLSKCIRECSFSEQNELKWIIVDGPVDSLWIESMNSLLDDNKVLCLPNNERIQLGPHVKMMFEVDNLDEASPATVSRCGMVYFDPSTLSWSALADSWKEECEKTQPTIAKYIRDLMNQYLPNVIQFLSVDGKTSIPFNPNYAVQNFLKLLNCYLDILRQEQEKVIDGDEVVKYDPLTQNLPQYFSVFSNSADATIPFFAEEQSQIVFERCFVFCLVWAFGGPLVDDSRVVFDNFIKNLLETNQSRCQFPPVLAVFDYYANLSSFQWVPWVDGTTNQQLTNDLPIEQQIVPTNEVAYSIFLSRLLTNHNYHIILQGAETSKTQSILTLFDKVFDKQYYDCHTLPLASCTTPNYISKFMMSYMHKKQGKLGPLPNMQLVFLLDNIGSVKPEIYGAQPPLEILRQFMDYGGWFSTSPVEFQNITGTSIIGTMGVPGGGRYGIPDRLLRHFFFLHVPRYNNETIEKIVNGLLTNNFVKHSSPIRDKLSLFAKATCAVYAECQKTLLPIPSKLHYMFNLRNIVHVIKGMLLVQASQIPTEAQFQRLWEHEMKREFHDRLNTQADRKWFIDQLIDQFTDTLQTQFPEGNPLYSTFSDMSHLYKEVTCTQDQLLAACNGLLEDHNHEAQKQLDIVLFQEAIDHLAALTRVFTMKRGHAMLVGIKSSGRKSLARLAMHVCEMETFEIAITRTYNFSEWRENLKELMHKCGVENTPTGFIITDVQIIMPQQLEDLSNLLISSEVPQLYDRDEAEGIKAEIVQEDTTSEIPPWDKFLQRIKQNLHIVLVFSPYGQVFKDVMLSFTALRNETVIDWYMPWSQDALMNVGLASLEKAKLPQQVIKRVISIIVNMHKSAEGFAAQFIKETKRFNAVTPSRFFELLNTFSQRLESAQAENAKSIIDYSNGIEKIKSTQVQIAAMREQLDRDIPILQKTSDEVNEVLKELNVKSEECEKTQNEVRAQSEIAEKEAKEATEANNIAQAELNKAAPLLEEAQVAVSKLDKDSLTYIKKLLHPSSGMKDTFDAVCIMFEKQPHKVDGPTPGSKEDDYWPEAVSLLTDVKFIQNISSFKIENMKPATVNKLRKYVPLDPAAREEKKKAAQQSYAAVGAFYDWVCAAFDYWQVYQEILPLKNRADEASQKLRASQEILAKAKEHLAQVEATLKGLQDKVNGMKKKEKELKDNVERTKARLERANKIMSGLSGESDRWTVICQNLKESSQYILGDTILISGVLTYLGVYSPSYRTRIIDTWEVFLREQDIKYSANFSIINALGNDGLIREWISKGLPNDNHSIENALIITQSKDAYPLLIDPQLSGTKWLAAIEERLVQLRFDQSDFLKIFKNNVSIGIPVLIENVGLKLDPLIDPILSREFMTVDGQKMVTIGGEAKNYSEYFKLFISTKYPNPQYSPEVCSQVQLINFTTTQEGLTDLLLNNLIEVERADLDKKRIQIMEASAENIKKLKQIEKDILAIVSNAGSDILDDDKAITTLQNAQATSADIAQQMAASESTEQKIAQFKQRFFSVASRAALLYFCVSDFSVIDPMYQFSLKWFVQLFRTAITNADHPQDSIQLIHSFHDSIAKTFYESVSFSLFSRHKLLFSTLMAIRILHSDKKIVSSELSFLLSPTMEISTTEKSLTSPMPNVIPDETWKMALSLEKLSPETFGGLTDSIKNSPDKWKQYMESKEAETCEIPKFSDREKGLSSFQKFLILRIFHLERVREGLYIFIEQNLGKEFVSPPTLNLMKVFKESGPLSPLIFIIMPGIDPQDEILGVTSAMELDKFVKPYSLGRGRGAGALELLNEAKDKGFIVLLQNCHLCLSFMPQLEHFINTIDPESVNPRFRICLVTMSSPEFPIGILYQGTKLIYEIPRGMRENVMRIYSGFNSDEYDGNDNEIEKQLTFQLAFFHSVVLERLQFGSIGWNIPYEFNPSDFSISKKHLHTFLSDSQTTADIPFEALSYVIGELNYGGRVTDSLDRRLLLSLLKRFFSEDVLNAQEFSFGNRYAAPNYSDSLADLLKTIESWPVVTQGEDVGLSANASTIVARNEAIGIFNSLIEVQPTLVALSESISEEQFALNIVETYQQLIPRPFNIFNFKKKFNLEDTISTVLYHEVILYNELLETITNSLKQMENGLKGLILIDQDLELLKRRLLANKVPELWLAKSFPSILTLRNYIDDLRQRVEFLDNWISMGEPIVHRLGAFFHPEEFLTAVLQVYARTNVVPFDTLSWKTTPITDKEVINSAPEVGIYIEGLPLEGAKWDAENNTLIECKQMELINMLPIFHLQPTDQTKNYDMNHTYECPVFRTQNRGTGALDLQNYILSLYLPTKGVSPDHWVQRSVAAFITTQ